MMDGRTQAAEMPQSRPLSMTAQAMRSLGLQNPQGEYLPQPAMGQPVVQQVSMSQPSLAPSKCIAKFCNPLVANYLH
jgi:hypothetical protein